MYIFSPGIMQQNGSRAAGPHGHEEGKKTVEVVHLITSDSGAGPETPAPGSAATGRARGESFSDRRCGEAQPHQAGETAFPSADQPFLSERWVVIPARAGPCRPWSA